MTAIGSQGVTRMDYQYQTTEQPSSPRKAWPIVLAVVVALIVACGAGVCVYRNKQQEALATCRQSLAEFSSARKAVLDTSENGSELQKLIRGALGVNDIIDAFADAATSAGRLQGGSHHHAAQSRSQNVGQRHRFPERQFEKHPREKRRNRVAGSEGRFGWRGSWTIVQ